MNPNLYETDFYAWTQEQVRRLRAGELAELDAEHLAEEVESMGNRDRRELINRFVVLFVHLLKWQFQPERRGASWRRTIDEQRRQIDLIAEDSPSLRAQLPGFAARAWPRAARAALAETGFYRAPWPDACPYVLDDALHADFWPE